MFGAGKRGMKALELLELLHISVGGVLDNDSSCVKSIEGHSVIRPEDVHYREDIFILVTPKNAFEVITDQLVSLGASSRNIYNYYSVAIKIGEMLNNM